MMLEEKNINDSNYGKIDFNRYLIEDIDGTTVQKFIGRPIEKKYRSAPFEIESYHGFGKDHRKNDFFIFFVLSKAGEKNFVLELKFERGLDGFYELVSHSMGRFIISKDEEKVIKDLVEEILSSRKIKPGLCFGVLLDNIIQCGNYLIYDNGNFAGAEISII